MGGFGAGFRPELPQEWDWPVAGGNGAFSSGGLKIDFDQRFPNVNEKVNGRLRLLWIACGKEDGLFDSNQKFDQWLTAKGIVHTWVEAPGRHSFLMWRRFLAEFAPLLFQERR